MSHAAPATDTARQPRFTVFIPTYNRADLIRRALASIEEQTCRNLEVVIVDDGSADTTADVVAEWRASTTLPVEYIRQDNAGKHAAHNNGVRHARGELFVVLDSDDILVPNALERLEAHWCAIPGAERAGFCGVEGLTAFFDGAVSGTPFPEDVVDSDYITLRSSHRIRGDKKGAIRSDVLLDHPYPAYHGERHMRPSWLWKELARDYRTRYVNDVIQQIEYQPGGLSADRFRLRMANPRGYRRYYLDEVNRHRLARGWRERRNACGAFIRYSLHAGIDPITQWREIAQRGPWVAAIPQGFAKFLADLVRMRLRGGGR